MHQTAEQAFELVLPFLSAPRDLLACSLTSSHNLSLISSHVQRGLQQLLHQLHTNIKRHKQQLCPGELKWLCSRQPGVINTEPVLQRVVKLLATERDEPRVQQAVEALVDAGLLLSRAVVVELAKQHHFHMRVVVLKLWQLRREGRTRIIPFETIVPLVTAVAYPSRVEGAPSFPDSLASCADKEAPAIMQVACNNKQSNAARLVWERRQHTLSYTGDDEQQRAQMEGLVLELLQTCAARQHSHMLQSLVTLPAAGELGAQDVLHIIHLALLHSTAPRRGEAFPPNPLEPLASLRGAQAISTDAVAHAIQLSFDLGVHYMCEPLLELQNARQIPSAQVCRLILGAVRAKKLALADDISHKLTVDRELDPQGVVGLIVDCLKLHTSTYSEFQHSDWVEVLESDFELNRHLHPANVVELYHKAAADRDLHEFIPALYLLVVPTEHLQGIPDKVGILAAMTTLLQQGNTCREAFRALVEVLEGEPDQQILPSECHQLLLCSLKVNGQLPCLPDNWEPLQCLGWAEVQQLLRLVVAKSAADSVIVLARIPAAANIELPLLVEVLQMVVSSGKDSRHRVEALLALPAAQQLGPAEYKQLVAAAIAAGHAAQVLILLASQPAGAQGRTDVSSSQIAQLLTALCSRSGLDRALVLQLLRQPAAAGLTGADAAAMAVAYIKAEGQLRGRCWGSVTAAHVAELLLPLQRLQQLPVMQQLQCPETLLQILTACLAHFGSHGLQQWVCLPAAQHLTGQHLQCLLTAALQADWVVLPEAGPVLLQLPACQHVPAKVFEELLMLALAALSHRELCVQSMDVLFQLPAAQQLCVQGIVTVANEAVHLQVFGVLQPLLQLPAAQQLTVEQVKPWVKEGLFYRSRVVFDAVEDLPCVASSAAADVEPRLTMDALSLLF